ncbi:MAG: hypothetical protein ACREHF_07560 [Rhizomicrobium sp.]
MNGSRLCIVVILLALSAPVWAGTAYLGGSDACDMGCGTVFELKPEGNGARTETTLHQFQNGRDGANPYRGLVRSAAGILYGATTEGPGSACGGLGCGAITSIRP